MYIETITPWVVFHPWCFYVKYANTVGGGKENACFSRLVVVFCTREKELHHRHYLFNRSEFVLVGAAVRRRCHRRSHRTKITHCQYPACLGRTDTRVRCHSLRFQLYLAVHAVRVCNQTRAAVEKPAVRTLYEHVPWF